MKSFILILRGPSGSGKTVVTKALQEIIGKKVAHLRADYFYWKVCPQDENKNEDNKKIVYDNLKCLAQNYVKSSYSVVIEGLLNKIDEFGLHRELLDIESESDIIYKRIYLKVDLETSIERNKEKGFVTRDDIEKWISEGDKSVTSNDVVIDTKSKTPKQLVELILTNISTES